MSEITRVGVDLAKSVIQVHAVDAGGKLVTNRQLSRDKFLPWCAQLPPGCLVAMEACGGLWRLPPLGPQTHCAGLERKNHRGTPGGTLPAAGQSWQERRQ